MEGQDVLPRQATEKDREKIVPLAGITRHYDAAEVTEEELGRAADFIPATYVMPLFVEFMDFSHAEVFLGYFRIPIQCKGWG